MRRLAAIAITMAVVLGVPGLALAAHSWSKSSTGNGIVKARTLTAAPTFGTITCSRNGSSRNFALSIGFSGGEAAASPNSAKVSKNGGAAATTTSPYTETVTAPASGSPTVITYTFTSISRGAGTWTGGSATKTVTLSSAPTCAVS